MAIWEEITCKRCRQKVHISNVKCDINGDLICIPCIDKLKTKKLEKKLPTKSTKRTTFQCLRCKYRFSFTKGSRMAQRCPYCDSIKIQRLQKQSADTLIKKSQEDLYDF